MEQIGTGYRVKWIKIGLPKAPVKFINSKF